MLCGDSTGTWRPLVEYSLKKGVSLSTLRRYIKAGKLQFKIENGRYLLFDGGQIPGAGASGLDGSSIMKLQTELQRAREEIAELKTLIAFYEEQPPARARER
jgi:hypothetical protein